MRDPKRKSTTFTRSRRRASLIATIMMAGSSTLSAEELRTTVQIMPPLPLRSEAGNGVASSGVQHNPFCEPNDGFPRDLPVQLASGNQVSAIRLKPIGAAIGLQPISSDGPLKIESPAIKIEEPGPATIRTNPLFTARYHVDSDLVEAEVDTPPVQFSREVPAIASSNVTMIPPVAPAPSPQPAIAESPMQGVPLPAQSHIAEPAARTELVADQTGNTAVDQQPNDSEPIFFSMSDDAESSLPEVEPAVVADAAVDAGPRTIEMAPNAEAAPILETAPHAETAPIVELTQPKEDEFAIDEAAKPIVELDKERVRRHPIAVSAPELNLEPQVIAAMPEPVAIEPPIRLMPATEAKQIPDVIYRSEPVVSAPLVKSTMEAKSKRYRPPVAVVAPPLAVARLAGTDSTSIVRPTVKPVEAPTLENDIEQWESIDVQAHAPANKPLPKVSSKGKSKQPTPLYLTRAQVRSLTVGGQLRRVSVADKSVCQAFAAGPNQLKLIGTGNGVTRLVVWADTSADAPTLVRSFEIHVNEAVDASGDVIGNKTKMLNQSIQEAFPACVVKVRQDQDRLVVTGHCDSEESAKKIVRMVRKTCLIPVHDELKVR